MIFSILYVGLVLFLVGRAIRRYLKNPFSAAEFCSLSFVIVAGLGPIVIELIDYFFIYKMPISDIGFLKGLFIFGYFAFAAGRTLVQFFSGRVSVGELGLAKVSGSGTGALYSLSLLSFVCIAVFIAVNGIALGETGYVERYENSRGLGILTFFFPAFLPLMAYTLSSSRDNWQFYSRSMTWVGAGVLTYIALSGYRQILMAILLMIGMFALGQNRVSVWLVAILGLVVAPIFLVLLSFIRYSGEASMVFDSPILAAAYFIQGDLFPVDAVLKIKYECESWGCPGWDVFFSHFYKLVPRFLWEDKPEILLNAAGYYTQVIVGYTRGVTLSPTILGEGMLVGGPWGVLVCCFFAGLLVAGYDRVMFSTQTALVKYTMMSFAYMGFFIIREGLQAGLYRTLVVLIFILVIMMARAILALPKVTTGVVRQ